MNGAIAIKNSKAAIKEDEEIEAEQQPESQIDWKSIWKPLSIIAAIFIAFVSLVVVMATISGMIFGYSFA